MIIMSSESRGLHRDPTHWTCIIILPLLLQNVTPQQETHPCISPTTVTGELTCTTLLSLINTSFVFSHISLNSASPNNCLFETCSIH